MTEFRLRRELVRSGQTVNRHAGLLWNGSFSRFGESGNSPLWLVNNEWLKWLIWLMNYGKFSNCLGRRMKNIILEKITAECGFREKPGHIR
jgi:hypothetical protein